MILSTPHFIPLLLLARFAHSVESSCQINIEQDELKDCPKSDLLFNNTCHSIRNSRNFLNSNSNCNEISIIVSVNPTKFSQLTLSVQNNAQSSNILEVHLPSQFHDIFHRGYSNQKVDLSLIKNTTFPPIHSSNVRLILRGETEYEVFDQPIDQSADFDIEFSPVLQTECPAECTHCCQNSNFKCYSNKEKCNDFWDCPDGEDEIGCSDCKQEEVQCPGELFSEKSKCIPKSYVCDGVKDCNCPENKKCSNRDGFEESQCSTCQPGGFLCRKSSICIEERLRCNLEADCPDGEDERNCPIEDKRKVLTAAIVGSLGCGVLFVIALGCTRRLFHVQASSACSRTRRNFQNLANILQVREAPPTYEAAMGIECFGTRQSRSRPWRLTRHGLRRDSRRRRRRVGENTTEDEPSPIEAPPITQASGEGVIVTEVQQVAPTDSMDSFDSIPTNQNVRQVAPETFNIASPEGAVQDVPEVEPENDTEDRKSISSNLQ